MINSSSPIPSKGKELTDAVSSSHEPGRLMDVRGVAECLNLDRQTIYNWLHQQKISGIKVGGVWRFDRRSIDAWLQSHTIGASRLNTEQRSPHGLPPVI